MFNFFDLEIIPAFLSRFNVENILVIGLSNKLIINEILSFCRETTCSLYAVDPEIDINELITDDLKEKVESFKNDSLNILANLNKFDAVFINDDANWYTVYNELNIIKNNYSKFPIIFVCNNKYPNKHRDSYTNPDKIPEEFRNEYSERLHITYEYNNKKNNTSICDGLYHAVDENTPKNGVYTAITDFIDENTSLKLLEINQLDGIYLIYQSSWVSDLKIDIVLQNQEENKHVSNDSIENIEKEIMLEYLFKYNSIRENSLDSMTFQLSQKNKELTTVKNRLINLEENFLDFRNELNNTKTELNKSKTELDNSKTELNKSKTELNKTKKVLDVTKKELSKEIDDTYNLKNKLTCADLENKYLKENNKLSKKIISPLSYMFLLIKSKPSEIITNIKLYRAIKRSDIFDIGYYFNEYPDIQVSSWCKYFSPQLHYVCKGFDEHRRFNVKSFKENNKIELLKDIESK